MTKMVVLTLAHVRYSGDSIGDDIRIEIETLNNVIRLDQKIKNGNSVELNTELGQFPSDMSSLTIPVSIRVVEKDLIFNDVGSIKKNLKINVSASSSQKIIYQIEVHEFRGFATHRVATFHITLISHIVLGTIRYISETTDGWLVGKRIDTLKQISVPTHLKVLFKSIESKRENCTILEGVFSGVDISIKLDNKNKSYLVQKSQQTNLVSLTYSISKKIVRLGRSTYQTTDAPDMRWKKGLYDIEIPDSPHRGGLNYRNTKYGKTWFRIGHQGDRYIHTGRHSLGCITMIEQDRWDDFCATLMKARKGDGMSVGVLEVID